MDIVSRAKNILLTPKTEWPLIAGKSATVGSLYNGYILPLAAIGPVALLVGFTGHGMFGGGLLIAVIGYVLNLVAVYVLALIFSKLAPSFGGRDDQLQALKLTAYSTTAVWIAAVARILVFVPGIGLIASLVILAGGIYSIYLFYLGSPPVLGVPQDKAAVFTLVTVIVVIVVYFVLTFLIGILIGGGLRMI